MSAKTKAVTGPGRGSKLTLGLGLVNVPVAYKPLNETQRPVPGKLMCPEHGPQLAQGYTCCSGTEHEHAIESAEIVKGFPHPDDPATFVPVDPAVLEEIAESRTGSAQIERIVDASSIDAAYFEKVYLVWPQEGGEAAFDLLAAVLKTEGKAAVTTTVMSKQTRTLVFRWSDELECLLAHVCRFDSQIRHHDVEIVKNATSARPAAPAEQLHAARMLLTSLEGEFDATEVDDEYTPLLRDAIRAAASGATFETKKAASAPAASATDLMASLMASLPATPKTTPKGDSRKKVTA
jgi:DNA end-binding protein Ku